MAQADKTNEQLQSAVALGERNKALLPRLRNWCRHLVIEDRSGGLVAEYYGLPMNLALSCPHAAGSSMSANLEMNARHFIEEQCIGCSFHAELLPRNFGRDVLAQYEQRRRQTDLAASEHAVRRAELQAEVAVLVQQEQLQGHITARSVLKLVLQLPTGSNQAKIAETIREAAGLAPQFFSAAALNYLTLELEGPIGPVLLEAIRQVLLSGTVLPDFAFNQVLAAIQRSRHLDAAVGVFLVAVAPADLPTHVPLLKLLLAHLDYDYRLMRDEEGEATAYPHVIELVQLFARVDTGACQALLAEQVRLPGKRDRIRVLGLLRDLIAVAPGLVLPLTEALVRSLNFPEDGYGESADHATRHTLSLLYRHAPQSVLAVLQRTAPTLSDAGQVELLEFYSRALRDRDLLLPEHAAALAGQLVADLAANSGPTNVREERLGLVVRAACQEPAHFIPHFTVLLGVLLTVIKDLRTLRWYQAELEHPVTPATTFNPLVGKHPLEIQSLDVRQQSRVSEAERMLSHLLRADSSASQTVLLDVFAGLSSETDGFVRSRLVKVLRDALPDPVRVGAVLPMLHASLFDADRNVRREALRLVDYLLDEQAGCVTQNLLEAVKVLLHDADVVIRGQAIQTYGTLMRQFAQEVAPADLEAVLTAVNEPAVALHKAAVTTVHALVPLLTKPQQQLLLVCLRELERAYYESQDFTYGQELTRTLLWLARDTRPLYLELAERYLTKYCACGDFYTEQDALKRLTQLLSEFPELRHAWLPQALRYLRRVERSYSSFADLRDELLGRLHEFSYDELVIWQRELAQFSRTQIAAGCFYDVFALYAVFGAQGLHAQLYELTQHFTQVVPATKATDHARSLNQTFAAFAQLEDTVAAGGLNLAYLQSITLC